MRLPARAATFGVALLVTSVAIAATSPATAASPPTQGGAVLQILSPWYQDRGTPQFADGEDVDLRTADTSRGIDARATLSSTSSATFTLTPPTGKPLTTGVYRLVGQQSIDTIPTLQINGADVFGEFDIIDLASDPADGRITRFDAVAPGIGEFRFGEDAPGSVVLGARNLVFQKAYVGARRTSQVETVHNTGSAPVTLGKPTVTGPEATSFAASGSTCGTTLASGATCTFSVDFKPKASGPASASLHVPIGGTSQRVALTGSAFSGKTAITSSGKDSVDKGKTTIETSTSSAMSVRESAQAWFFSAQDLGGKGEVIGVRLQSPGLKSFPRGTRATTTGGPYKIVTTVRGLGCDTTGTMTVKQFLLDPVTGLPDTVDMSFTQYCFDKLAQRGSLQWQARPDVAAPGAPTAVRVSATSTSVQWKPSPSSDAVRTVARLVQGDGTGATPQSGVPLDVTGTSATLPTVPTGQRYTVAVFAVDAAGNVSSAGTAGFGTTPVTVMTPSSPTITGIEPGPGSVTVSFTPPASDGGLPITGYEVSTGSFTATGSESPITLTGLPRNNYQVRVNAVNAAGKGLASASSASFWPEG